MKKALQKLTRWFVTEPLRVMATVELVLGFGVTLEILDATVVASLQVALAAWLATVLRSKVTPVATLGGRLNRVKDPGDPRSGEQIVAAAFDGDV